MSNELTIVEQTEAQPVKLKWFTLWQNNSGGFFTIDENVAEYVIIQATSAEEAQAKAESFCSNAGSCPCCGDRWSFYFQEEEGTLIPMIYGTPAEAYVPSSRRSNRETRQAKLHFWDGRISTITLGESTTTFLQLGAKS